MTTKAGAAAGDAKRNATIVEQIKKELDATHDIAGRINIGLGNFLDRFVGPTPKPENETGDITEPDGAADQILTSINNLQKRLASISDKIARLESIA